MIEIEIPNHRVSIQFYHAEYGDRGLRTRKLIDIPDTKFIYQNVRLGITISPIFIVEVVVVTHELFYTAL